MYKYIMAKDTDAGKFSLRMTKMADDGWEVESTGMTSCVSDARYGALVHTWWAVLRMPRELGE